MFTCLFMFNLASWFSGICEISCYLLALIDSLMLVLKGSGQKKFQEYFIGMGCIGD